MNWVQFHGAYLVVMGGNKTALFNSNPSCSGTRSNS